MIVKVARDCVEFCRPSLLLFRGSSRSRRSLKTSECFGPRLSVALGVCSVYSFSVGAPFRFRDYGSTVCNVKSLFGEWLFGEWSSGDWGS